MPAKKSKNTGVLIATAIAAALLVTATVALDEIYAPIDGVIRAGALLGYLGVFLAGLSSNFMRELTRYFGRPFIKTHHLVSVTALTALIIHATAVAWRAQSAATFLPEFNSLSGFLTLGGRPALWLLAVTSLTALFRAKLGKSWKTIHWLNYVAFLLGTAHAILLGQNFQHIGVRIVAALMAVALLVIFVLRRTKRQPARSSRARKSE